MKKPIRIKLEWNERLHRYYVVEVNNSVTHRPGDELKVSTVEVLCGSPAYDVKMVKAKK